MAALNPALRARLRAATDPDALLTLLRQGWQAGDPPTACRVLRLFPQGEGRFVVACEIVLGGRTVPLFAELGRGEPLARAAELTARLDRLGQRHDRSAILPLPEAGLVLRPHGLDERLPGIALLQAPELLVERLQPVLPERWRGLRPLRVEMLGHRLYKRLTARLTLEGEASPLIVKLYSPRHGRGHRAAAAMAAVRREAGPAFRVPWPIAWLEEEAVLVMETVAGRELTSLGPAALPSALHRGGAALRTLHALPLAVAARHDVADELALLARWVELTADLKPRLGLALEDGWASVRPALLATAGTAPLALLHRDFYDQQLLVDGAKAAIIDYDTLAHGDPALDVGNFLAHLELRALEGRLGTGLEAPFLAGYAPTPELRRRTRAWRAAARLRLACLYAFSSTSPILAERLLAGLARAA